MTAQGVICRDMEQVPTRVPTEHLPPPTPFEYVAAAVLFVGLLVGAALMFGHGRLIAFVAAALAVLALLPGWLWRRHGYTFLEGWASGVVVWPLSVAFGIWGPRRA